MKTKPLFAAAVLLAVAVVCAPAALSAGMGLKATSESTATGFKFPESVGCDSVAKVLYVSQFGSELKPTQKDGQGYISKASLDGKILEQRFLPAEGTLNKPKGIWVAGDRLWVTDIDVVWVFDLKTRKGRKVALPGIQFANDPTVVGSTLYVSDNRGDALYSVHPADFLNAKAEPAVKVVFKNKGVNPNGLYPGGKAGLLMVGFKSAKEPRPIFVLGKGGAVKALSKPIGRLDGVYRLGDGSLLVTDWDSGSLFQWSAKGGMNTLAKGFKGPADLCVMHKGSGLTVYVPDLVKSEVRIVELAH